METSKSIALPKSGKNVAKVVRNIVTNRTFLFVISFVAVIGILYGQASGNNIITALSTVFALAPITRLWFDMDLNSKEE